MKDAYVADIANLAFEIENAEELYQVTRKIVNGKQTTELKRDPQAIKIESVVYGVLKDIFKFRKANKEEYNKQIEELAMAARKASYQEAPSFQLS